MDPAAPSERDERQRAEVARRWQVLRPAVQDGVPLAAAARDADGPQRWLARYRAGGLAALARGDRADRGVRRLPEELVRPVEGLALQRPRPSTATIARWAGEAALARGWPVPAYSTVHSVITGLDPQLLTLAHDGPTALRDRYELVYRSQSDRPNQIWQADHTELDLLVLDEAGEPARPWLTVVLDDCSRAIAGFTVFLGAPSAVNLSLALRQAIWRKTDSGWAVHGLPDVLYADHGSDVTSDHSDTGLGPQHDWLAAGCLPRPPDSLEQLDLLLVQVAAPRMVHRDGIRFLCRAISREHAGQALTLKRHLPLQVTAESAARTRCRRHRFGRVVSSTARSAPPRLHAPRHGIDVWSSGPTRRPR